MGRPPLIPVEKKTRIVLSALAGALSIAVPCQVVGRVSLVLNVGVSGVASPGCTSLGRFHEMAS